MLFGIVKIVMKDSLIGSDGSPRIVLDGVPVFCRYDEIRDVADMRENPMNPNKHPKYQLERLAEVIVKTGWRAPITVSSLSGMIVKGHGRLQAALLAGCYRVPVEVQHYSSRAQEEADLLADNRLAELSEIDGEALAEALRDMERTDSSFLGLTGYSDEDIKLILDQVDDVDENDLESKDDDNGNEENCLKFDGRVIPLTAAEGKRFILFMDSYMARNGGLAGAVQELLMRGDKCYLNT